MSFDQKSLYGSDFSFDKIKDFDAHITLSIPNYTSLNDILLDIASYFIQSETNVYDIGCSTGVLLQKLAYRYKNNGTYFIGYDISENLLKKSRENIMFFKQDITADDLKFNNTNLIFSIFTLQFLSIEQRLKVIQKIYNNLNHGGAFIYTEKVYCEHGMIQDIYNFSHYDYKLKSFDEKTILDKQRILRKIMRPITSKDNVKQMKKAGFSVIEPFFQTLNFKGWICIK